LKTNENAMIDGHNQTNITSDQKKKEKKKKKTTKPIQRLIKYPVFSFIVDNNQTNITSDQKKKE